VLIYATDAAGDTPNDYEVRVTCTGNVCIGTLFFYFSTSSVDGAPTGVDIFLDGASILTTTYTSAVIGIEAMCNNIMADINANSSTYCACAIGNNLWISRLVTSSEDGDVNALASLTTGGAGTVGGDDASPEELVAVASNDPVKTTKRQVIGGYLFSSQTTILANVTGGIAPYTYLWSSSDGANILNPTSAQSTVTFTSKAVTVQCKVTDARGIVVYSNTLRLNR